MTIDKPKPSPQKKLKFLSNRYRECDYDYVAKLPQEAAEWLANFSRGYYEAEGLENDPKAKKEAHKRKYRSTESDAMLKRDFATADQIDSLHQDNLDPERLLLIKEEQEEQALILKELRKKKIVPKD